MTRDQLIVAIHETRGRLKATIAAAQPGDPLAADINRLVSSLGRIEQHVGADPTGAQLSEQIDDFEWLTRAIDLLTKRASAGEIGTVWTRWGFYTVALTFLGMCAAATVGVWNIGSTDIQTLQGGRAVLLLALTGAFVVLGGSLLIAPLFADGPLKDRIPFSREVFLLFAGMFTTVVGFYFASADQRAGAPLLVAETFDASVPEVRALVTGSRAPYTVQLEAGEAASAKKLTTQTLDGPGEVRFALDPVQVPWPKPMKLTVRDASGQNVVRDIKPDDKALQAAKFVKPSPASSPAAPASSTAPASRP